MISITPKTFKRGDKFLMITTGDVWVLQGFQDNHGHICPILNTVSAPGFPYSPNQPTLLPIGRRPTKAQIEALKQIVGDVQ